LPETIRSAISTYQFLPVVQIADLNVSPCIGELWGSGKKRICECYIHFRARLGIGLRLKLGFRLRLELGIGLEDG